MVKENEIVQSENSVRLPSHTISLGGDQADIQNKIMETYRKGG